MSKLEALYPVIGLASFLLLLVILMLLSSCKMSRGIVNEGNHVEHAFVASPTPYQ
jgi:hypothetical protein